MTQSVPYLIKNCSQSKFETAIIWALHSICFPLNFPLKCPRGMRFKEILAGIDNTVALPLWKLCNNKLVDSHKLSKLECRSWRKRRNENEAFVKTAKESKPISEENNNRKWARNSYSLQMWQQMDCAKQEPFQAEERMKLQTQNWRATCKNARGQKKKERCCLWKADSAAKLLLERGCRILNLLEKPNGR